MLKFHARSERDLFMLDVWTGERVHANARVHSHLAQNRFAETTEIQNWILEVLGDRAGGFLLAIAIPERCIQEAEQTCLAHCYICSCVGSWVSLVIVVFNYSRV